MFTVHANLFIFAFIFIVLFFLFFFCFTRSKQQYTWHNTRKLVGVEKKSPLKYFSSLCLGDTTWSRSRCVATPTKAKDNSGRTRKLFLACGRHRWIFHGLPVRLLIHVLVCFSAFGLGSMIYIGLEFGSFFEIPLGSPCHEILRGVNPLLQMIFTFMQMYFIFMNSRVSWLKACMNVS